MHQADSGLGAILVHGLWHGGWVWDAVRRDLDRAGVANAVVELPMTDLAADIAATSRVIDGFDRPCPLRSADFDRCDAPSSTVCPNGSRGAAAPRRTLSAPTTKW